MPLVKTLEKTPILDPVFGPGSMVTNGGWLPGGRYCLSREDEELVGACEPPRRLIKWGLIKVSVAGGIP